MDIAIENSNTKLGIQGLHKDCYFTSSKADFVNEDNDFINARYLKSHMINYLRQHINELPERHENTEIRSDWEIRENEERLIGERDTLTRERDALTGQGNEQRDVIDRQERLIAEQRTAISRRDEIIRAKDDTINNKQRVIDWYKEHWKSRDWFGTTYCPFE